jgi:predicted helicase
MNTKQIGDNYEIFILNYIKNDYDNVWLWKDVPEKYLYELNIIKNYDIYSKYRYDLGIDIVACKDNNFYFIQCKNF